MKKTILFASLVFGLNAFAQIPSNVPTLDLVGYWPFEGNANDMTSNANNGTVHGATSSTDRYGVRGYAYCFNGTSDYIRVPSATSLSGFANLTISVWAKTNALSGTQCMTGKWWQHLNCGNKSDTYETAINGSVLQFATNFDNITGLSTPPSLTSADVNVWRHFVFVYDNLNASFSVYIDGVLVDHESITGTGICSSTNDLLFGADEDGYNSAPTIILHRFFNGCLDDIGIWKRVLAPCEILALYAPAPKTSRKNAAITTGFNEPQIGQAKSTIGQNEPNPFTNETVISYNLSEQVKSATLVVYDMSGAVVTSVPLDQRGNSSVTFTSEKLSAGIYLYSIVADNKKIVESKKMIVMNK